MTPPTLEQRLAGAVWGHLVGDAMGVPYEFSRPGTISSVEWGHQGTHHKPPGTWSDDGALMLALLDSLLDRGFDADDQARRALNWMDGGSYTPDGDVFDIGATTRSALSHVRSGTAAASSGRTDEGSNGNGSLMRILPVALDLGHGDDAVLVAQASAASAVTHAHPRSRVTCALYVLLARNLLAGEPDRGAALGAARASLEAVLPEEWRADYQLLCDYVPRTGSGYVVDCFWSAWQAFTSAASYAETIENAVRFGKDTDTTACVAGGLAGIYWGVDSIPGEWRQGMRGRGIVEPLVAGLQRRVRRGSGTA